MLSINDLEKGLIVKIKGGNEIYSVSEVKHQHIGRGGSSIQTKLKNIKTGQVCDKNFKPSDEFEEIDVEKIKIKYLYSHRDEFWFSALDDPKNRFSLKEDILENAKQFLKTNLEATALKIDNAIFAIELPIKVDYKVVEAPPAVRGNTAQGGTKTITIESGAKISTPLFINEGDIVRVNTQTGEYAERIEKV